MSTAQSLNNIEGKWKDPLSGGIILVYEEGGLYIGQLIGADDHELDKKIKEEEKVFILENFELRDQNTLQIKWKFGFLRGTHSWERL